MSKRIEWIDVAKAIGIVLVVYGHVILGLHDSGLWTGFINYRALHDVIYSVHMPLFFFLSGIFAINWVERAPGTAIGKKALTLLVPYFLWGFIQASVMQVFAGSTNNGQGLANAVKLPFIPYAQFWFLYDLFWIFLIYYLLINYLHLTTKVFIILSFILMLVSPYLGYWELWRISYHMIFFAIGTLILKHHQWINRVNFWAVVMVTVILNSLMLTLSLNIFWHNALTFVVACSGILLLAKISKGIKSKKIDSVGRQSMVIYLLHLMFTAGSRIMLMKVGMDNLYIQMLIGLLLGVFAPLFVLFIANKMRISKYLFG
ncbi:Uncharacterized membrane protein YcfT (YcfT) [Fructobacillus fructosus]|uniref:acyltransferase family protein n=1 Tax=Fructobacillus fructosus TaxID=1631 RepID=UPI002DB3D03A|nr:Uncharacterized membrane protein YcfT (YcfT) [Fructobacillus fructosus]